MTTETMQIEDRALAKDMLKLIDRLERMNDAVGCTPIRRLISEYIVRTRLLVRDGNLTKLRGGDLKLMEAAIDAAMEAK